MRRMLAWVVLAVAVGCGGKVIFDGVAGDATAPCESACDKSRAACPAAECGGDSCSKALVDSQMKGCVALFDQLSTCIVNAVDPVVCGAGKNVPDSCQSVLDQWNTCIATSGGW